MITSIYNDLYWVETMGGSHMAQIGKVSFVLVSSMVFSIFLQAGVEKTIQERYRQRYENKALFLKTPIRGDKQVISVGGVLPTADQSARGVTKFKVGDQVRILNVGFGSEEVRFKVAAIDLSRQAELIFRFPRNLQESFPEGLFNATLNNIFTEGLSYSDIDESKRRYLQDQFERMVSDLAGSSNTSRDFVLQALIEKFPSYASAKQDLHNLEQKNVELESQLSQFSARVRSLESERKQIQTENTKLKSMTDSIRSELGSSDGTADPTPEIKRLKQQLSDLKKAFNIKAESGKELSRQIEDLNKASKQLQQDKARLDADLQQVKSENEKAQVEIKKLSRENVDLKSESEKLSRDLKALNLKGDSLSKSYLQLQQEKDKLDDLTRAVTALRSELTNETFEDGYLKRSAKISLGDVVIGSAESRVPREIRPGETKKVALDYTADSIDYLKLSDKDRKIINSLGEKYKIGYVISNLAEGVVIKPLDSAENVKEVQERSPVKWEWEVLNQRSQDPGFTLQVFILNKHDQKMPLITYKIQAQSPDLAKKLTTYLQPIPVAFGALCGFLLVGILGVFRRSVRRPKFGADYKKAPREDYIVNKKL